MNILKSFVNKLKRNLKINVHNCKYFCTDKNQTYAGNYNHAQNKEYFTISVE